MRQDLWNAVIESDHGGIVLSVDTMLDLAFYEKFEEGSEEKRDFSRRNSGEFACVRSVKELPPIVTDASKLYPLHLNNILMHSSKNHQDTTPL